MQRLYHTSLAQSTPLLGIHKGGLIPLTAPDALRASGNSAQAIRPMGGRKACVSVVRFTVPIVAVTAFISNTKNENSYAIKTDFIKYHFLRK